MVLKDKDVPENEGKVFLYQFGQKIFEKIKSALRPKQEDDPAINVFDFWDGADFNLEIAKVKGYRNYDDSKFRVQSPLFKGDDSEIEKLYKQLYKLQPFVEETRFKSYEDLEKKFNDVVSGVKGKVQKKADELFPETDKPKSVEPVQKKSKATKETSESTPPWDEPVRKPKATAKKEAKTQPTEDVPVDDNLDMYDKLLEQD